MTAETDPPAAAAPTKWQQAAGVAKAVWANPWGKFLVTVFAATWAVALCHSRFQPLIPPQLCRLAESLVAEHPPAVGP